MIAAYDYGRRGRMGVLTPQANPTVEAEFSILLPPQVAFCAARLTSAATEPLIRLTDYIERMAETVAQFDAMKLDTIAFACTGSSYLVGPVRERTIVEGVGERFGAPVITATMAIERSLRDAGAKRIVLVAPYPDALIEAAETYWRELGFEIAARQRVVTVSADTRSIYALSSGDAARSLSALKADADAVLLSGTGMPGLAAIRDTKRVNIFSSNLCLCWAALSQIAPAPRFGTPRDLLSSAATRLDEAISAEEHAQ